MIKIVYIVSTLQRSGPTNQLFNIIKDLDRNLFQPYVITLSPEPKDSLIEKYLSSGIGVQSIGCSRVKGFFWGKKKAQEIVDFLKPDIIHTQGVRGDMVSASLDGSFRRVSTVRNYPEVDYKMTYGHVRGKIYTKMQVFSFRKMDVCCGVSDAVSKNLNNLYYLNNTITIRNGVSQDKYFSLNSFDKQKLRQQLSIPLENQVFVTTLGKDMRKDTTTVIKSFLRSCVESDKKYLIVLGEGVLKKRCQEMTSGMDNVIYPGRVANVVDFLQASDFFISSSKAEGMPNAVLEAMACGLPTILSDIPPHREIFEISKESVFLFDPGSSESLEKAIRRALETDYAASKARVMESVDEHLGARGMSNSYQSIYKKLLSA